MTDVWKEIHKKKFAKALKKYRNAKGISIRKLAVATKLSSSYISYLERGIHGPPSIEATKKIAAALDVNSDILLAKAGHVDHEITEAISKNPEQITSAIRNTDSTKDAFSWGLLAISVFVLALFYGNSSKKETKDETPETIFTRIKEMLEEGETSLEDEKEYFRFAEQVLQLWKNDLEGRN